MNSTLRRPSSENSGTRIYPIIRLSASLGLTTIGIVAMYIGVVGLKPIATEFGITRGIGSLPYAFFMIGFGIGNIIHGRIGDRYGTIVPALIGSATLPLGLILSAQTEALWHFFLIFAIFSGMLGASGVFTPIIADISHWFTKRRGLAVAIVLSGSYFGGALWPPIIQYLIDETGWRATFQTIGYFCLATMIPLSLLLYRRPPYLDWDDDKNNAGSFTRPLGLAPNVLQCLLCFAGIGCCVGMSMPQVHIVAYSSDLGYTTQRGAEMLSIMLACGVISRLVSGWISDRVGGIRTLLVGSGLQILVLTTFLFADSITALYIISACFGLSQGGIVPSYAIIIRSYFPPGEAGWRIGATLFFTLIGMAFGGWVAGFLYDITGSYTISFINALGFNVLNFLIVAGLLARESRHKSIAI